MATEPALAQLQALARAALPSRSRLEVVTAEPLGGYQHPLWALRLRWQTGSGLLWTPPTEADAVLRLYRSPLTWWRTDDLNKPARELALNPRLAAAGLPVPEVLAGGNDTAGGLGPYLLMARATGRPWFTPEVDVRAVLTPLLVDHAANLARLHALPAPSDLGATLPRVEVRAIIAWYRELAVEANAPDAIAMAERLDAMAADRVEPPASLIHGSPDFGNVLLGQDGRLSAWLDWEDAALADPHWDVAAVVAYLRVFRLADLGQRFVDGYQAASGRNVTDLTWWLAVIALRGLALTVWLAHRRTLGTAPEFPGLEHWLFSLPRYRAAAATALPRAEGWARLQAQRRGADV